MPRLRAGGTQTRMTGDPPDRRQAHKYGLMSCQTAGRQMGGMNGELPDGERLVVWRHKIGRLAYRSIQDFQVGRHRWLGHWTVYRAPDGHKACGSAKQMTAASSSGGSQRTGISCTACGRGLTKRGENTAGLGSAFVEIWTQLSVFAQPGPPPNGNKLCGVGYRP